MRFNFRLPVPVRLLLAGNTESCPRHSLQPLLSDFFFALEANTVATVVNPTKGGAHLAHEAGLALKISSGQFARGGELYLVQRIGGPLNGKILSPSERSRRFGVLCI
jgi:hypothetical protein